MSKYQLIVIGASLGGSVALKKVLSKLPSDFGFPIAAVIHRAPSPGKDILSSVLQVNDSVKVVEAEDKMSIDKAHCYIAPADYHLLIDDEHFALSSGEKINYARPSIDVLFESAADYIQTGLIAILLTGNSADGSKGLKAVKENGGLVIIQDPLEAEAPLMPSFASKYVNPDYILTLDNIAQFLLKAEGRIES